MDDTDSTPDLKGNMGRLLAALDGTDSTPDLEVDVGRLLAAVDCTLGQACPPLYHISGAQAMTVPVDSKYEDVVGHVPAVQAHMHSD